LRPKQWKRGWNYNGYYTLFLFKRRIYKAMPFMKAVVFVEKDKIELCEKLIPEVKPTDALVKITTTTICGTDVHILKAEYPVKPGLTIGHEPVGVIDKLGSAVAGYQEGQRVLIGAITPCGQCSHCLNGFQAQCGGKAMGGWRFGNTIDGAQAEYILVPNAAANLTAIPDDLTDEQVLMCPDVMSTGISGAESGGIRIGDTVAVFAQGPIGLLSTAGAKLMGATQIIGVSSSPEKLEMARVLGADEVVNYKERDPVDAIMEMTNGRGVDVAIEALGEQITFENSLRVTMAGGTCSTLGVFGMSLAMTPEAFAYGIGDKKIVSTLCPGGKARMSRLISIIGAGRMDLREMVTHTFSLDEYEKAYDYFANKKDGCIKVALKP